MTSLSRIFFAAALALLAALPAAAAPLTYKAAAAPWDQAGAATLPRAITPDFLKAVGAAEGPAAAAALAEKKARVEALLARYVACSLRPADGAEAAKYFTREFAAEVRYFAEGGCLAFSASAAAASSGGRAVPSVPGLEALNSAAASGALSTREGSARFFDNAAARGSLPPAATAAPRAGAAVAPAAASQARPQRPLAAAVPPPSVSNNPFRAQAATPPPADLGKDGRVNTAIAYWGALRRENWAAYRYGGLEGADKAKAFLKAAAGAGFGGLLYYSNLGNVEIAAARLGWSVGAGERPAVIAADAAKLAFHSGVFVLALAPIPLLKVGRAALAGEPWAVALMAAFAAGPANRVFHFAD